MTDAEAIRLLQAIHDLAMLGYPYPPEPILDGRLAIALGRIAGMASRVIEESGLQEVPAPASIVRSHWPR